MSQAGAASAGGGGGSGISQINADAGSATGSTILIDPNGLLGTSVSSIRFKEDIKDLSEFSNYIMDLRPVSFKYKNAEDDSIHFGFIAEEVNEVFPELVIKDPEGKPYTVEYHETPALLLLEIQKLQKRIEELEKRL